MGSMPGVLVLVENNSVPSDTRVWSICRSLRAAGWEVTVISPRRPDRDTESYIELDGVAIHRFSLTESAGGAAGYVREYGEALLRLHAGVRRVARRSAFDVVHACNPPDVLLLAAIGLRRRGTAMVFDHHDLSPELYAAKGGRPALGYALARAERLGFSLADVVLATNESFREVAITRGGKAPEDVFVVRNGPEAGLVAPVEPDPALRAGAPHLIGFVGLMGDQDGVVTAIEALGNLRRRRDDWRAIFVGDGESLPKAKLRARELGLADAVAFPGFVRDRAEVMRIIASLDVCLSPEPRNRLNESSTLIKVAEYMAMGKPVVAFDLTETRRTAGPAAVYAADDTPRAFADAISGLLDDPEGRERLGAIGRERVSDSLAWKYSETALLAAYGRARELAAARGTGRRR